MADARGSLADRRWTLDQLWPVDRQMSMEGYPTGAIQVAEGVYAFIQPGGATNAAFIVDDDGVIVVDTLMTPSLAERLLAEVRQVTDAPVRYIVNTHWHGDHTFGNAVLPSAPVLAHDTCREDLLGQWDAHRAFLRNLYPDAWPEISGLLPAPPDLTFSGGLTLHLAQRVVRLLHLGRAHTRGDILVHLRDDGVLIAGDIAFHRYIPNARDGFPSDWLGVSREARRLSFDHVVPGHGPLGRAGDLAEMEECLALVIDHVRRAYEAGQDEDGARKDLRLGPFATWGRQEDRLPTLVSRLYREFRGELD